MARFVPHQQFFDLVADITLSPARQSAFVASFARKALANVEAKQGVYPVEKDVDGKRGASEDEVKPTGRIIYFIHPFTALVGKLLDTIYANSPWQNKDFWGPEFPFKKYANGYRGQLHFREMFKVILNGEEQPWSEGDMKGDLMMKAGDELIIVNPMPYARKMERGVQGKIGGKAYAGEGAGGLADGMWRFRNVSGANKRKKTKMTRNTGLKVHSEHRGSQMMELAANEFQRDNKQGMKTIFTYIPLPAAAHVSEITDKIPGDRYPAIKVTVERNLLTGGTL